MKYTGSATMKGLPISSTPQEVLLNWPILSKAIEHWLGVHWFSEYSSKTVMRHN